MGAKGTSKKKSFAIGQFVTINNDKMEKSLLDKLYAPRSKNIYKIIDVNKDGFAYSVQNVLTGSISEVIHWRIQRLSLTDLECAGQS